MSEQARRGTAEYPHRGVARSSPVVSWVLAALCCVFLLLYLAAQGRAVTLMFRGFASKDVLSYGGTETDVQERLI